jgi:polyhydroxyalkanoate synthesis regulator phasin
MHRDLAFINELGFTVVAMTIIGLPYDTEQSIMELADWVTTVSRYQTANFLTPLPATSNWTALKPLNESGELLEEGEMRPYQLYTGRQFVHYDERWSMQESREIFDKYTSKLQEVDDVYRRVFRILRTYKLRLAATSSDLSNSVTARLGEATDTLHDLSDSASLSEREFGENISGRVGELVETLRSVSQPLSNVRRDAADSIGSKLNDLTESLKTLADPSVNSGKELAANISRRITEVTDAIDVALSEQRGGGKKAAGQS